LRFGLQVRSHCSAGNLWGTLGDSADDGDDGDAASPTPGPRVLWIDLTTAAPTGVILVTVDLSNGSFDHVLVGSVPVPSADPSQFVWEQQSDPSRSTFALRLPADVTPGIASLRLAGPNGESAPLADFTSASTSRRNRCPGQAGTRTSKLVVRQVLVLGEGPRVRSSRPGCACVAGPSRS
jgi:hypothetical protein